MILRADHPDFDGLIVPGSPLKIAGAGEVPNTRTPASASTPITYYNACSATIRTASRNYAQSRSSERRPSI